jgi:hypothetical protein
MYVGRAIPNREKSTPPHEVSTKGRSDWDKLLVGGGKGVKNTAKKGASSSDDLSNKRHFSGETFEGFEANGFVRKNVLNFLNYRQYTCGGSSNHEFAKIENEAKKLNNLDGPNDLGLFNRNA